VENNTAESGKAPATGAPQIEQTAEAAPLSVDSQAALTRVADLRREASTLTGPAFDAKLKEITDLTRHALHGEKAPHWYQPAPDPREVSTAPHDSFETRLAESVEPPSAQDLGRLQFKATIKGVPPSVTPELLAFVKSAELSAQHSSLLVERFGHHVSSMGGNLSLSDSDVAEFRETAARALGGFEKLDAMTNQAMAYLKSVGLGVYADKFSKTSLAFDPRLLIALSGAATARGIK